MALIYTAKRYMALRLIRQIEQWPTLYPKVERKLATVKEKGWTRVDGFELRRKIDYIPQPGLQEDVCASECNLIFMCGQGTAGKTFRKCKTQHARSTVGSL